MVPDPFRSFETALIGKPVTHVWRGYGSALFLEFGALTECMVGKKHPRKSLHGEYSIMIEWSWRIEDASSILCGSWSDEVLWQPTFERLLDRPVVGLSVWGRLPELVIDLADGLSVISFMTADGQPSWTIFERSLSGETSRWITVEDGKIVGKDAESKKRAGP